MTLLAGGEGPGIVMILCQEIPLLMLVGGAGGRGMH